VITKDKQNILLVLDSPPEENCSVNFYNSYITILIKHLSKYLNVSLFYPVISLNDELYALFAETNEENLTRFYTFIPPKSDSFTNSFESSFMDDIFEDLIKREGFDIIHVLSLKNHSFNYPFIAKNHNIPLVISIHDNFIKSPLLFENSLPSKLSSIKISNFVASPIFTFLKKVEGIIKRNNRNYNWYEQIGRYSSFYNNAFHSPDEAQIEKRITCTKELINFTTKFHFFSEESYNSGYADLVPHEKTFFIEQGIDTTLLDQSRPFELDGDVQFGFIGNLIPEEGVEELVEAFKIVKEKGFGSRLHLFGEIYKNREFFNLLKKKAGKADIIFHGAVDPERLQSILDTFHVLIIPEKWHRSDTFLIENAIASRKAVIISQGTISFRKAVKNGRGMVLGSVTPENIADSVVELETNRKKLYYHMRITDDYPFTSIDKNIEELISLYLSIMKKERLSETQILSRKLFRKRIERIRGTA